MISKILKASLILFWMILIFLFSMDTGIESSKKSDGFVIRMSELVLRRNLTEKEKNTYIEKYQVYVRKIAHFSIYFCLGFSTIWFLSDFHPLQRKDILMATMFVFLYACSDEIHQLFVSGRSGEIIDVLIDTIGGLIGSCILYFFHTIKTKKDI